MTDKAVSALTSLTGANTATGDLVYIVDISEASAADRSKKITAQELQNYMKKFPATIGVGAATPAASGAGISFPATVSASSDANTLDDYEEGTYDVVVTASTSGTVTLVGGTDSSSYTKVGRQVTVTAFISVSSVSSPIGYFTVSLPFPIGTLSESQTRGSGSVFVTNAASARAADFILLGVESESNFRVYLGDNVNIQTDSAQELQGGSSIYFTFTYFV
jgi:hypothetical protein